MKIQSLIGSGIEDLRNLGRFNLSLLILKIAFDLALMNPTTKKLLFQALNFVRFALTQSL